MAEHILITGCSGGGKSTLLAALAQQGHAVVREPGERIVRSEMASGGMGEILPCHVQSAPKEGLQVGPWQ
ncbi:MAG: AAA family ATPase, partial [Pseudomonadota bacterium]